MDGQYQVIVLKEGYSSVNSNDATQQKADGTITLLKGDRTGFVHIIVDTGNPWDGNCIIEGLQQNNLTVDHIRMVVCTHGHSDHVGNLNLFKKATHIVGFDICCFDVYTSHPFQENIPYEVNKLVKIIPTPGHTLSHVSVLVSHVENKGTVAIAGDLFEKEEDMEDPSLWQMNSEDIDKQTKSRTGVLAQADYIIPGHGKGFIVKKTPAAMVT